MYLTFSAAISGVSHLALGMLTLLIRPGTPLPVGAIICRASLWPLVFYQILYMFFLSTGPKITESPERDGTVSFQIMIIIIIIIIMIMLIIIMIIIIILILIIVMKAPCPIIIIIIIFNTIPTVSFQNFMFVFAA